MTRNALFRLHILFFSSVASFFVPWLSGSGQESELVHDLSPFEVSVEESDGYYADQTLAGTRLRTSLRHIAQSVTIVTMDQMEDTGVVDENDLLLYEANTEGSGNYSQIDVNESGAPADGIRTQRESANRIRGLPTPDRARDYFPSLLALGMDSYNTRQVTISRGPNSILFGLGAPSGIINYGVNYAVLNETYGSTSVRFGEYGHYRGTIDWNQSLVKNRLAVRFAAMYHEDGYRQKPSTDRRKRLFGSFRYQPFDQTVIEGYYERIEEFETRPNSITPIDLITPWKDAGANTWNPVLMSGSVPDPESGLQVDEHYSRPLWAHDAVTQDPVYWIQRHDGVPTSVHGPTVMASALSPVRYTPGFVSPGFSDSSYYDVFGVNLQAVNQRSKTADVFNLVVRHRFTEGLNLEVGMHHEDMLIERSNFLGGRLFAVAIDPNTHLANGEPNPYYGHAYIETGSAAFELPEEVTTFRATLSYELDLRDIRPWLGEHRFSLLGQRREMKHATYRYKEVMTNTDETFVRGSDLLNGPSIASVIHRRFYLGEGPGEITFAPAIKQFGGIEFPLIYADVYSDPFGPPVFAETMINVDSFMRNQSTRSEGELDSIALAWQGLLFQERIVPTFGIRRDTNITRSTSNLPTDSETGLPDYALLNFFSDDLKEAVNTATLGAVVFPLKWVGFHYNYSENFQPSSRQLTLFGDELPSPKGVGRDYGFSVSLLDDSLVMRFNWFKTNVNNARNEDARGLWSRVARFDERFLPDWARQVGVPEEITADVLQIPSGFPGDIEERGAITNLEAKGFELELTYQPSRRFRLKFNLAKQETIESSVAPFLREYMDLRRSFYEDLSFIDDEGSEYGFWQVPNAGSVGSGRTPMDWWNLNVDPLLQELVITEGKVQPQQRKWRANLVGNYNFNQGYLRGVGVGGAVRWEDKGAIGFLGEIDADGGLVLRDEAVFDGDRTNFDFWVSWSGRILNDRVRMRVQFNVQNAFEGRHLRPIRANPDGSISTYRIVQGRTWFVTTNFNF